LLDKLDVYAGFGIREVWTFENGTFTVYEFEGTTRRYAAIERSRLVPDLDLAMIARYAMRIDTPQALRELDAELRQKP
jgi:hypothetical protein